MIVALAVQNGPGTLLCCCCLLHLQPTRWTALSYNVSIAGGVSQRGLVGGRGVVRSMGGNGLRWSVHSDVMMLPAAPAVNKKEGLQI